MSKTILHASKSVSIITQNVTKFLEHSWRPRRLTPRRQGYLLQPRQCLQQSAFSSAAKFAPLLIQDSDSKPAMCQGWDELWRTLMGKGHAYDTLRVSAVSQTIALPRVQPAGIGKRSPQPCKSIAKENLPSIFGWGNLRWIFVDGILS